MKKWLLSLRANVAHHPLQITFVSCRPTPAVSVHGRCWAVTAYFKELMSMMRSQKSIGGILGVAAEDASYKSCESEKTRMPEALSSP